VFGIGPTEFIIIAVVALLLFSPRELPKILRSAAKFWASLRNTADEFKDAIMNEEELQDLRGVLSGTAKDLKNAETAARRELMKARMEMQKAQNKLLKTVKATEEARRAELAAATTDPGDAAAAPPPAEPVADAPAQPEPAPADPPPTAPHGAVAAARPGAPDRDQGAA
jgi:Tat protein translocase TatB subunit